MEIEVNDNNFEEKVLKESKKRLVIVDFWAEWCMPCLMLGPILKKISDENPEKILLAKLNVDKNPLLSKKYGINSIPAVKFFKNNNLIDEFIGALPESYVREYINRNTK
jgi:putative thioredoxin